MLAKHARPVDEDPRTAAQRNHDALTTICDIAVRSEENGSHRGLPVTPIITMTIDQLEDAAGVATTATGGGIPVSDALKLAERSRPWLAIFDHTGRPLHLGRSKRLANLDQRIALIAFDRGCTRPGCTKPPTLCAVHHPHEWINGGPTDIDNETFACDPCHALITGTDTGWRTIKAGNNHRHPGRTLWIPPKHIAPDQKPRINHAHHPEELLDNAIEAEQDDDP